VARFCTLSHSNLIQDSDIPCQTNNCLSSTLWQSQLQPITMPFLSAANITQHPILVNTEDKMEPTQSEHERLTQAMEKSGWVQAKAARLLNLTPRQIGYALKKHNIEIKKL
jgi:Nif-specific regulatory protein